MTTRRRRLVAALVVALLLAGCGGDDTDASGDGGGPVVSDVWARPTPPLTGAAAFFLEIANEGAEVERITAVSSPGCAETLVHTTAIDDGVATMARAEDAGLTIEPGERLLMEPLGLHVMCLGPEEPLVDGETFELTIEFDPAGAVTATGAIENR